MNVCWGCKRDAGRARRRAPGGASPHLADIQPGHLPGAFLHFLEHVLRSAGPVAAGPEPVAPKGKPARPRKFLNREQAELDAMPRHIERLEAAAQALAEKLADPRTYTDFPDTIPALQAEMEKIQDDIARQYARWEELEALKREFGAGRASAA